MAKADCRRDALHDQPSELDGVEAALHGLTKMAAENGELLLSIQRQLAENQELILAVTHRLDDLTENMDRLMKHLDVPPKRGMGFLRDEPSNGQG